MTNPNAQQTERQAHHEETYGGLPLWRCATCGAEKAANYGGREDWDSPECCGDLVPINAAAARFEREVIPELVATTMGDDHAPFDAHDWQRILADLVCAHDRRLALRQIVARLERMIAEDATRESPEVLAAIRASGCGCVECREPEKMAVQPTSDRRDDASHGRRVLLP